LDVVHIPDSVNCIIVKDGPNYSACTHRTPKTNFFVTKREFVNFDISQQTRILDRVALNTRAVESVPHSTHVVTALNG
jgi:hypothetical protein